jgi:histone H3/H4
VAAVAKALGALWKELTDAQRQPYHDGAAQERARVQAHVFERQQKEKTKNLKSGGADSSTSPSSSDKRGSSSDDHLVLPLAKVKKICKLDPDVRGLSREAVAAVARASELVLARLGCEAVKVAAMQNRRTLMPDDVVVVCQNREQFSFLREDLVDLARLQHQQKIDHANSKSKAGSSSEKKSAPVDAEEDGDVDVDDEDRHTAGEATDGNDENRAAASRKARGKKQKQKQRPTTQPPPPPPPSSSTKPLTAYFGRSGGSSAGSEPLTK